MKKVILLLIPIILFFSCKNETQQIVKIEGKQISINKKIPSADAIETLINPTKEKLTKKWKLY